MDRTIDLTEESLSTIFTQSEPCHPRKTVNHAFTFNKRNLRNLILVQGKLTDVQRIKNTDFKECTLKLKVCTLNLANTKFLKPMMQTKEVSI
jgi:hypothetical protein